MRTSTERAAMILRSWGGAIVALALAQATAVAWVAWYLIDAVWAAARPTSRYARLLLRG